MEPIMDLLTTIDDGVVRVHQRPHASTVTAAVDSSSSAVVGGCNPDFEMDLLSSRITDTDLLVQSLHLQNQEIADLKAQLGSLNQSVMRVTQTAQAEQQKSARLLAERDEQQRTADRMRAELAALQDRITNEHIMRAQEAAVLEQRTVRAESELIDVCRQYLVQGNLLADHHLSNGDLNRHYMKVGEMLKRRGENVDGLLRTTSSKKRRPSRGCTVATQTPDTRPTMRSTGTSTTPTTIVGVSCGTMTDATRPAERRQLCDRATQALPTTTTRGTSTVTTKSVCVATSCPEPIPLDEIFRQTIVELPAPLSPIDDLLDGTADVGCQTAAVAVCVATEPDSPEKIHGRSSSGCQTATVGTITNLANVRKRIEYARKWRGSTASGPSSLGQQYQQHLLAHQLYEIKKEEAATSPFGSLQDLNEAIGNGGADGLFDVAGVSRAINPQLSGLWRVLGQMIFGIIGSGRIFDDGATTIEVINRNLTQIQTVMEMAQQTDSNAAEALAPEVDAVEQLQAQVLPEDVVEKIIDKLPAKERCMETIAANETIELPVPLVVEPIAAAEVVPVVVPKIRVIAEEITNISSMPNQTVDISPQPDKAAPASDVRSELLTLDSSACPSQQSPPASSSTSQPPPPQLISSPEADDVIFKRPTSAVRRMSARQKAIVRKNLARRCKPIASPPSYSIDKNFKRARRKSIAQAPPSMEFQLPSPERICARRSRRSSVSSGGGVDKKRVRLDGLAADTTGMIDVVDMIKFFSVPQMIEPISDYDVEDEQTRADVPPSSTLLQDLFGDGNSSSDSDDEPMETSVGVDEHADAAIDRPASPDVVVPQPASIPYESDYSPASPPPPSPQSDDTSDATPALIPTETILPSNHPVLRQVLDTYSHDKLKFLRKHGTHPDASDARLFAQLHRLVLRYLDDDDFTTASAEHCTAALLARSTSRKWLAACLLEHVEDIDDAESVDLQNTPPAPALTHSHQRIVLLVTLIDRRLAGFLRYCLFAVEQTLFKFSNSKPEIGRIVNLVRYHLALDDLRPAADTAGHARTRLFIYKCLYYYQHTATPMVYTVLLANPQCLPVVPAAEVAPSTDGEAIAGSVRFGDLDPLVQALHVVLANTNYGTDPEGDAYKKAETFRLLRDLYRYPTVRHDYTALVDNMLQRIRDGRLQSVANALILAGKRNGFQWTQKHLLDVAVLPQLLRGYLEQCADTDANDERIACLLHTMGSLVKPFPVTEDISGLQAMFGQALTVCPRRGVQEAAVGALLQTARFGALNVYRRIADWQPDGGGAIGRQLWLQLQTFVHRKKRDFWT